MLVTLLFLQCIPEMGRGGGYSTVDNVHKGVEGMCIRGWRACA